VRPKEGQAMPSKKAEARMLTAPTLATYKPGKTRRRIRDLGAQSLFLIIEPSGHKSWQMRFRRPDGKPGKMTLGPVDFSGHELKGEPEVGQPLSLVSARLLAQKIHRERKLGHDPIGDNKARKHRQRVELKDRAASTFAAAAQAYVEESAKLNMRRWRDVACAIGFRYPEDATDPEINKGSLAGRWADKTVSTIDAHLIWSVIDEARRLGIPGMKARTEGVSEARARHL